MAQPSQIVPTVTMNVSGTKQQVNLRDYLNVRVAPFLKRAIHDSLEAEPEYPLQWLGEYLIQQSLLFEGNPDATNIRERFVYNHDMAAPKAADAPDVMSQQAVSPAQPLESASASGMNGTAVPATVPQDPPVQEQVHPQDTDMGGTL